jgi:predicted ester cyclase
VLRGLASAADVAYLEADFVGRHIGEFAGVPATGREVNVPYCVAYDVKDGHITELRGYFPLAALINQLNRP